MSEDLVLAGQWLAKANNDLLNADNNLKAEDIPFDTVCFHCQQAAEKMLKAYLAAQSEPYPPTHDLLLLLERILPLDSAAEVLRNDLATLMPYSVEIRYPDDWFMPSEQDARQAANHVQEWLGNALPALFKTA